MPEGIPVGDSGATQIARTLSTNGLIQLGEDGRLEPRLAKTWRWEDGGHLLRVTLEPDLVMHDGQPVSAARVAAILTTATRSRRNRTLYPSFNYLTSITPDGPLDVLFRLSTPSMFLAEDLELPLETGNPPISTGPFRIVRSAGGETLLEPFPDYRGGAPRTGGILVTPFPTLRAAWTSLLRGDIDIVTDVPPDVVEFVQSNQVEVQAFPRRYQYLLAFNSARTPFQRPAVRRALNFAVNRQDLVARVLRGRGTPSTGPLWPKYWAYDPTVTPFGFDPAAAETLLDTAGLPRNALPASAKSPPARFRFTCLVPSNFAVWERIGLEVQKNLYAIGVDMQFKVVPFGDFDNQLRAGAFDAALVDMISGPTPGRTYLFWRSGREPIGLNVFGYSNPDAERQYAILRTTTNDAAIRSATQRLQRTFLDDPPALFLAWNEGARAVRREYAVPTGSGDPLHALWKWQPGRRLMAGRR